MIFIASLYFKALEHLILASAVVHLIITWPHRHLIYIPFKS